MICTFGCPIFIVSILISCIQPSYGQTDCTAGGRFGEGNPQSKDNTVTTGNNGMGYQMREPNYIIDCCGVASGWEAYFKNVVGSRTVWFQIWRPLSGTTYTLVGENSLTVTSQGEFATTVASTNKITIKSGDIFGWWTDGDDIITYKGGGGEENDNFMLTISDLAEGATQDWGSAVEEDGRSYAIRLDVDPSSDPTFSNLPGTVSIVNSVASATSIFTVTASDPDPDDVSTMTVTMSASSQFSFDSSTKIVSTATTFASSTTAALTFTATDQCGKTTTSTLTVTVTNEAPVINNLPSSVSLSEDTTTETLLFTINATDSATSVTCSLASSVPASYPYTVRQITASTDYGIYVNQDPGLDYNTLNQYDLGIECSDGQLTDTETFTVYLVKNAAPVFVNLQNSTVISTSLPIGANVFTVIVTDAENDDLTFSMSCDPTGCPFQIFASGSIQISQDVSAQTTVGYDINITVSDGKNTVGPKILTVTFSDINNPVTLTNLPHTRSVPENTAVGTTLYTVTYDDDDASQTRTFSWTASPTTGTSYFDLNSSTGEVTVSSALNYEALSTLGTLTFTFTVTVSDPVTSDTGSLVIQVSNVNEAPTFSQSSYSLSTSEGSAGDVIGTPSFGHSDPDSGDVLTLTLDCGTSTAYFAINPTFGQVSFQSLYDLDTGTLSTSVACTVNVTDSNGLYDTATLTINIADSNDNTPVFSPTSYSFYISYYAVPGTAVGTITATDGDTGSYGVLTYSLDQTSLSLEYFSINSNGDITVATSPNGNAIGYATSVTITATASDVGGLSDTASVVIIISDTTTTSTTTTTDRYRDFLEDTKNIAWLVACVILLVVILIYLGWLAFTCRGKNGCRAFCRNCKCRNKIRRRVYRRPSTRISYLPQHVSPPPPPPPPPPAPPAVPLTSVRKPPPPKGAQKWRLQVLERIIQRK